MSDPPMKSPEEVRQALNDAREAFKIRHGLYTTYGVTSSPTAMLDYTVMQASVDDEQWEALLDEYIRTYTWMLERDQELREETQRWRNRGTS